MSTSSTPSSASKRGLSTTPSNTTSSATPSRSPTRPPNPPSTMASSSTTPVRAGSIRSKNGPPPSAKAALKRNSVVNPAEDDDAKAETAALIDDLKEQLRKTESASEQYQKELQVAQSRLDEALAEQTKLEETVNQHSGTVGSLESQLRDVSRQKNDLETQRDTNEAGWTKEREAANARETELNQVVQRLKDTLAQRESRQSIEGDNDLAKRPMSRGRIPPYDENTGISTPPLSRRDSSQNQGNSQLLLQKDRVIEDLRLELAEATVKVMEVDRAGGGRQQELEKQLLEVRMTNAKLMEDNESYQFLLQERTLNGTFANRFRATTPSEQGATSAASAANNNEGASSLADELENAGTDADTELEEIKEEVTERRRMEKEMTALKDQNKAMTLYIDKIITRLLASDHYESIFDGTAGSARKGPSAIEPTVAAGPATVDSEAGKENANQSLLQRAGSIFGNRARPSRPSSRVTSSQSTTTTEQDLYNKPLPTPNEDPTTAPSVPFRRGAGHRRTGSDRASQQGSSYTTFTTRTPSGTSNRPTTPSGGSGSRHASLSTASPPRDGVILEDDDPPEAAETTVTRALSESGPSDSTEVVSTSSPPRSTGPSSYDGTRSGSGSGGPAVFSGSAKSIRPLKLVQERVEADAERKKQNRGSWAGWFNKATESLNLPGTTPSPFATGYNSGQSGQPQ